MNDDGMLLVVGEIIVDYTLSRDGAEPKLRLGGIVHGCRGLWAAGIKYSVAAFCPSYLQGSAEQFLKKHGCTSVHWIGEVTGAPNVMIIGDPLELADQGYDDLLRNERQVIYGKSLDDLDQYTRVVIFPGNFDLSNLASLLDESAKVFIDAAYDVTCASDLSPFQGTIDTVILSTSSEWFLKSGAHEVNDLLSEIEPLGARRMLLKENRGGSRLFDLVDHKIERVSATLGSTKNSVGVGDVYSAVYAGLNNATASEAAWIGATAATCYSQTTYPDDFQTELVRQTSLGAAVLKGLGGTSLSWHDRKNHPIYLAAPDFTYMNNPELDQAISCLQYHNFDLRRPVQLNGELDKGSGLTDMAYAFEKDWDLLSKCDVVFAVPLDRDPGTLVEIGMAIAWGKPVITYDPRQENNNTMVVAGSKNYSDDLDECLGALFETMSKLLERPL